MLAMTTQMSTTQRTTSARTTGDDLDRPVALGRRLRRQGAGGMNPNATTNFHPYRPRTFDHIGYLNSHVLSTKLVIPNTRALANPNTLCYSVANF